MVGFLEDKIYNSSKMSMLLMLLMLFVAWTELFEKEGKGLVGEGDTRGLRREAGRRAENFDRTLR